MFRLRSLGWRAFAFLAALMFTVLLLPSPAHAAVLADPAASTGSIVPTTGLWGLIIGALTPPLVAVIQQPGWSTRTRSLVASAVALGFGVIACYVDGSLGHGQTVLATMAAVLVASQTTYRELWSKIGVTEKIEAATSSTPPPAAAPVESTRPVQSPFPDSGSPTPRKTATRSR